MTKRDFIYVALLIALATGPIIDAFTGGADAVGFTLNDAGQLIATIVLCVWWEMEDAKLRGGTAATLTQTATVFLAPLGLLIYFFQSRKPIAATIAFVAFIGGALLAIIGGAFLGGWLVAA
jgi:hypothetical protein